MKTIRFILIFTLAIFFGGLQAQDRMVDHNGKEILCHIHEVTDVAVRYQMPGDSTVYELSRTLISRIYHSTGVTDLLRNGSINRTARNQSLLRKSAFNDLEGLSQARHLFHIGVGGFVFAQKFSMGIERILPGGRIGLKVPVDVSLREQAGEHSSYLNWRYSVGFDGNFYIAGNRAMRYYLGPGIRVGSILGYYYDQSRPVSSLFHAGAEQQVWYSTPAFALLLNNGIQLSLTKGLIIGGQLSLGAITYTRKEYSGYDAGHMKQIPVQDFMYDVQLNLVIKL